MYIYGKCPAFHGLPSPSPGLPGPADPPLSRAPELLPGHPDDAGIPTALLLPDLLALCLSSYHLCKSLGSPLPSPAASWQVSFSWEPAEGEQEPIHLARASLGAPQLWPLVV